MYYKCVKFHKNTISGFGGVAAYKVHGRTDRVIPIYPQTLFAEGIINVIKKSLGT